MHLTEGISIAIVAGSMNGLFPLPMKASRQWAWENFWLPFSFLSLAVFPWVVAGFVAPHLLSAYKAASTNDLLSALACGILVYTGSLLFGLSLERIGVALGFALLVGTMSAVGVLAPRLVAHRSLMAFKGDRWVLAGVALCLVSVVLGFYASQARIGRGEQGRKTTSKTLLGASFSIAGGLLSGMLPAGMAMPWAHRLMDVATASGGAPTAQAANVLLAVVLLGGSIPNCGYCLYLLNKNATHRLYLQPRLLRCCLAVLAMSLLYSGSIALWGLAISPSLLGTLGPSVGWALFVGLMVIASTAVGLLSGEWNGAPPASLSLLALSLAVLIAATVAICNGTYLG